MNAMKAVRVILHASFGSFTGDERRVRAYASCLRSVALLGAFSLAVSLRAEISVPVPAELGSGVTIKLSSPVASVPRFGFMPVRVSIENLTGAEGTWGFRFESGNARVFPGLASSAFELTVPAARSREAWFYVPLAEPGISISPTAFSSGPPVSPTLPPVPPPVAGVYPDPKLRGVSYDLRSAISSGPQGLTRTFTITQIGPGSALPNIPSSRLPPGSSVTVKPRASDGLVVRTTTIPVTTARGGGTWGLSRSGMWLSNPSSPHPTVSAMNNARNQLAKAGLNAPGVSTSSSVRLGSTKGGTQEVTVTLRQRGPAMSLPLPDLKSLPAGFTAVNILPDSADGSTVVREFTFVDTVVIAPMTPFSMPSIAPVRPRSPSEMQAEARRILAPTKLLEAQPGVKTSASTQYISVQQSGLPLSPGMVGHSLVLFEQTGPASALPQLAPAALPAGVRTTVLPAASGNLVTRLISYVDPTVPALLTANVTAAGPGPGATANAAINSAKLDLQRSGFLRSQPGVSLAPPTTRSAVAGATGPHDLIIFTETGPASLLAQPPPAALPIGISCSVTAGAIPGEVARNFVVNVPGFLASASTTVPLPTRTGARPARVATGTMPTPGSLAFEATGPGLNRVASRLVFPSSVANTAMPPLATTPALEQVLRGKFSASGTRAVPNLAGLEPAQLPADWRVWSSFNAVLLKTEDFAALDPARRATLRSWVATGGLLFLSPEVAGEARIERVGAGRIETLAEPVADLEPAEVFAQLQVTETAPGMPERERMTLSAGTPMGDIVSFAAPDVLWVSLLVIVFALLVGPGNVFFFAPPKKRHRLFFTTPLFSLCGAAAIALAIVLHDGLGGEGLRRTLVRFVPGESQAAVFQEQAARSGFLVRRDFPLDERVICSVLPVDGNVFTNTARGLLFTREEARAIGDWFRNRSRQAQLLRTLAPTRARVEIVGLAADGAPQIESTLATELRDFRLRDDQGRVWSAENVPTGRRTTLSAESRFAAAATATLEATGNGTPQLNLLLQEASTLTDSWQWVARGGAIDIAPIATLSSIRWNDDPVVYAGVATRAGQAVEKRSE